MIPPNYNDLSLSKEDVNASKINSSLKPLETCLISNKIWSLASVVFDKFHYLITGYNFHV